MPTMEAQAKFKAFIETKEVSAWLFDFEVEGTKATYSSALYRYWSKLRSNRERVHARHNRVVTCAPCRG